MSMRIAVCIKSVPDPDYYDQIVIDPVKKTLQREGIPSIINISDKHALEQAIRLKEQCGGEISVISMAPPAAKQQLLEALAMGADKAYLLSDRKVAGADTLATSYTLSVLLKQIGPFDIVFTGNESADGATSHVPSQLAVWMGLSHSANVISFEMEDDSHAIVVKPYESGRGTFRVTLPAVIAVNQRINEVRLPNMMGIMKAKNKPLEILGADDLTDLDDRLIGLTGSPSKNGELRTVEGSKDCIMLEGTDEEIADKIFEIITPVLGIKEEQ